MDLPTGAPPHLEASTLTYYNCMCSNRTSQSCTSLTPMPSTLQILVGCCSPNRPYRIVQYCGQLQDFPPPPLPLFQNWNKNGPLRETNQTMTNKHGVHLTLHHHLQVEHQVLLVHVVVGFVYWVLKMPKVSGSQPDLALSRVKDLLFSL